MPSGKRRSRIAFQNANAVGFRRRLSLLNKRHNRLFEKNCGLSRHLRATEAKKKDTLKGYSS